MRRVYYWLRGHTGVIGFTIFCVASLAGFWSQRELIRDETANRCIDDWQLVEEARKIAPISNEALIEVFPDADPDRIREVREVTARLVEERIEDPDCDLEAARRQLGD